MTKALIGLMLFVSTTSFASSTNLQNGKYVIDKLLSDPNCKMKNFSIQLEEDELKFSVNDKKYPTIELEDDSITKIDFEEKTKVDINFAYRGGVYLDKEGTLYLNLEQKFYSTYYNGDWTKSGTRWMDTVWKGAVNEIRATEDADSVEVIVTNYTRPYSGDARESADRQKIKQSEEPVNCYYSREKEKTPEARENDLVDDLRNL